jgi:hypothetical protein
MKTILLLLCTAIFMSCNSGENKSGTKNQEEHVHTKTSTPLTLNNGKKWNADSATNKNVTNLQVITDNFKRTGSPSVTDYKNVGNELNTGIQKMITDCKMTGPDHEALHHWLEPVLKETNQLQKAADTFEAGRLFDSLSNHINSYYNFFE